MRAEDYRVYISLQDLQRQVDWLKECIQLIAEAAGIELPVEPD